MLTFPVPAFVAVLLAVLSLRLLFLRGRFGWLGALLLACAVQALILTLVQHYGITALRPVQPATATAIPVIAWLAFQNSAIRSFRRVDLWHGAVPLVAIVLGQVAPAWLDLWVPAVFAGYGLSLIRVARRGGDALPRLRLGAADMPAHVWLIVGAALIGSALSDVIILLTYIADLPTLRLIIVSFAGALTLAVVGWLSLMSDLQPEPITTQQQPIDPDQSVDDAQFMARLAALMDTRKPYLDPDLSLSRLARQLGVPQKTLSAAINRSTGQNVSKYINDRRIAEAMDRLRAGEQVTAAYLSCGFNTKSNFNREFLRVTGKSPTAWMQQNDV